MSNTKTHYRSHKRAILTRNIIIYFFLIVLSIVWLVPFFFLIMQSLSSIYNPMVFIPSSYTFQNYVNLFTDTTFPFWRWWINTFVIALVTTIFQTVFVLGSAYAFSRLRFKLRQAYMKLILIIGIFPSFLSMIVIYFVLQLVGLESNIYSLIIINVAGSVCSYYIAKGFFDTIPRSLDEAAMIDGANKNTIFFRVIMPLSKPIVIYTILISFTGPWGEFMMSSYIAGGNALSMTVAVGLRQMITQNNLTTLFPTFCAGGVVVAIPIMILFFALQKYYVEGITGGAVKG